VVKIQAIQCSHFDLQTRNGRHLLRGEKSYR